MGRFEALTTPQAQRLAARGGLPRVGRRAVAFAPAHDRQRRRAREQGS